MPNYEQKSKKPWSVRIKDASGKRVMMRFTCKVDAVEYEEKIRRERQRAKAGLSPLPVNVTFNEFKDIYLKKKAATLDVSPTTLKTDDIRLNTHWTPKFGNMPFKAMTKEIISDNLDSLVVEKKLSAATRNRNRTLLHHMFEIAIEEGRYEIEQNPVSRIKVLSEKKQVRKMGRFESTQEAKRYISAAFDEAKVYGVLATIALFAGPRMGELIALRFDDMDFSRKTIRVDETFQRGVGADFAKRTKGQGAGGEYYLVLLPIVEKTLIEHMAKVRFKGPNDFVLQRENGDPLNYDEVYRAHYRILKRAGLKKIRLHGLRHTFASMADDAGLPRGDISASLGHGSLKTTNIYIHKNLSDVAKRAIEVGFGVNKMSRSGNYKQGEQTT